MSAPYILSQAVLKTFFSCMKSCSLSSRQTISRRRTWFVARVQNMMSGKKLKEELVKLVPASSNGSAIGGSVATCRVCHRLHEIVQELSFAPSGAKPTFILISYSKQGGFDTTCASRVHRPSNRNESLCCSAFRTKPRLLLT